MTELLIPFFLILVIGFAGGVPFGPVNLSVLNTSLEHNSRAGVLMSLGSATAEMMMAAIAIYLTSLFTVADTQSPWIKVVAMFVFIGIGLFFYHKEKWFRKKEEQVSQRKSTRHFFSGFAVNMINPQIIPFWVIIITWMNGAGYANLTVNSPFIEKLVLTGAVFLGKGSALVCYSLFSDVIKNRAQRIRPHFDRAIGVFLVCLGCFQGATAAWEYFL